jgi:hypothetical protein
MKSNSLDVPLRLSLLDPEYPHSFRRYKTQQAEWLAMEQGKSNNLIIFQWMGVPGLGHLTERLRAHRNVK